MTGDNYENIINNPSLEGYKSRDINVLILDDPVDSFWTSSTPAYLEKNFKSVTRGADDLEKIDGEKIGNILLKPTHVYVNEIIALKKITSINAISHITGGGFDENIPRMLGENQKAIIKHDFDDWPSGKYFKWLMETTGIPKENLVNTFNCGVGLIISVNKSNEEDVLGALNQSLFAKTIGKIEEKGPNESQVSYV